MISDILLRLISDGYRYLNKPCRDELKELFPDVEIKSTGAIVKNIPTIEQCLNGFQWSPADNELALFILLRGEPLEYYGVRDKIESLIKLCKYGIDWSLSSPPRDCMWESFAGTFAEPDRQSVLQVEFDTLDKSWQRWSGDTIIFGVEAPSISDLIRACSGYFLKTLEKE